LRSATTHAMRNIAPGLRLEFIGLLPEALGAVKSTVGPANLFRLSHNRISVAPHDQIAATFLTRVWSAQGQHFAGFQCKGASIIHFERPGGEVSRYYGPFDELDFQENSVRVAHGQLFAAYQSQNRLWHSFALSTDWPVMVLTAASYAGTRGASGMLVYSQ
jgi:hypothetical protein